MWETHITCPFSRYICVVLTAMGQKILEKGIEVMTKQEFLDSLRAALSGRVSTGTVMENISFYEDYINTQVRMGKSEFEVLRELGDPRLLARSIMEAEKRAGMAKEQEAEYGAGGRSHGYARGRQSAYGCDGEQRQQGAYGYRYETGRQNGYGTGQRSGRVPLWLIVCLVLLFIVLILSFVFSVLSFLAPILIPILLITLTIRLFRRLL